MSTPGTVPFFKLRYNEAINARATTNEGIDDFAESIAIKGIIEPLIVRPADNDTFEVINGGRRFRALGKLVKAKRISKKFEVPVAIRNETDAEALETSLMSNIVRLPMHAVEQHEVFARLTEGGSTDAEIAARFGITERTVRQHKALGRLAPEIRDAWKKGKIEAKVAQAFTLHESHEVQAAAFERLKKARNLTDWGVRGELSVHRVSVKNCAGLNFVGVDTYRLAGGEISDSLFDDERFVEDAPLVRKLAHEKLETLCAELRAEGWSWAIGQSADDDDDGYNFYEAKNVSGGDGPDDRAADAFTSEERARSGCVIEYHFDGSIKIYRGLLATGGVTPFVPVDFGESDNDADGETAADDLTDVAETPDDEGDTAFAMSQALTQTVTEALTVAAANALESDSELAVRLMTAALMSSTLAPSNISMHGHALVKLRSTRDFPTVFAELLELPFDQVSVKFAQAVAATLDLTHRTWIYQAADVGNKALRDALNGGDFLAAAREAFNPTDYFKRSSKAAILAAVDEMKEAGCAGRLAPEDVLADMKKSELADAVGNEARAFGWLPPALRHPEYQLFETAQSEAA